LIDINIYNCISVSSGIGKSESSIIVSEYSEYKYIFRIIVQQRNA